MNIFSIQENDFVRFMSEKAGIELPPVEKKPEDDFWLQLDGGENVKQLGDSDFDEFVEAESSVMVMFYAPCELSEIFILR